MCVCKDGEVLREDDEDSEARDCEGGEHRGGGIGDTSSESGRSVDQRGYLSESEEQVLTQTKLLYCTALYCINFQFNVTLLMCIIHV